jgi:hypothetical protein
MLSFIMLNSTYSNHWALKGKACVVERLVMEY